MQCSLQPREGSSEKTGQLSLRILLRMEDNMNRQLSCFLNVEDDPVRQADSCPVSPGSLPPSNSSLPPAPAP